MTEIDIVSDIRAVVLEVMVSEGDEVSAGQELVVLESMKTEIPIAAPSAGVIGALFVHAGDEVEEQQPLLKLKA